MIIELNNIYCGDCLELMKEMSDKGVDLIYLDPPFNSKATYNVLYKEKNGTNSEAQITAFEDTWQWNIDSERAYEELVIQCPIKKLSDLIQAFRSFLGTNDMMAYLTMMAIRLVEMHRLLKPTGSIYLHCDPTASHYLKLILDSVFNVKNLRNEIVWGYRTGGVSTRYFARKHDILLFYTKTAQYFFERQFYKSYQMKKYNYSDKYPEYFDDEKKTWYHLSVCRDVWEDLSAIGTDNKERLGYPTQKPEGLLERIIKASSNKDDIILDPFCGCGTSIAVAKKLNRKWIGIDISPIAIDLCKKRIEKIRSLNELDLGTTSR